MTTLDIHHNNYLAKLKDAKLETIGIRERISFIDLKDADFEKRKSSMNDAEFGSYMTLVDERIALKKRLVEIENTMDESMYFVNTSDILFKYYDLIENGNKNVIIADHDSYHSPKSILRFFTPTGNVPPLPPAKVNTSAQTQSNLQAKAATSATSPAPPVKPLDKSRGSLLDTYMSIMDPNYMNQKVKDSEEFCPHCESKTIITMLNDGYTFCSTCHSMENMIVDHDKPSYKDPPKEITYFSYKRINHLNEWLNQVQGKETTEIPEEIYDKILFEIKKQRITNMADLSPVKVKKILKQLKVHKYYEHIPHIINRLNGLPMPNFTPELEEKLRTMFKLIQTPFLKHSPPGRKNFLSYSYCLHKFLQLLEKDEFLSYFCLLRSREKLQAQDVIWSRICFELSWQFIPSL